MLEQEDIKVWRISVYLHYLICMRRKKDRKLCDTGRDMDMSRQGEILIYCVKIYKNTKNFTGKQVAELFNRYKVWSYVHFCFETLHTMGLTILWGILISMLRTDNLP